MSIDWMDQAACDGADPRIFFIEGARSTPHARADEAKTYCDRCPVTQECWLAAAANRDMDVYRAGVEIRRPIPVCAQCGDIFTPERRRNATRRYCSEKCRDDWQTANAQEAERAANAVRPRAACGTKQARDRHRRRREACTACRVQLPAAVQVAAA